MGDFKVTIAEELQPERQARGGQTPDITLMPAAIVMGLSANSSNPSGSFNLSTSDFQSRPAERIKGEIICRWM